MTEEEAKTKWCPFVRINGDPEHGGGDNRRLTDARGGNCIGSACMAWRWDDTRTPEQIKAHASAPRVGHCGLAGSE